MIISLIEALFDAILAVCIGIVCVVVISAALITLPLWIIPYKLWKKKGGEG